MTKEDNTVHGLDCHNIILYFSLKLLNKTLNREADFLNS
jgi:hypothetical protein